MTLQTQDRPLRILIIDDNPHDCELVALALKAEGGAQIETMMLDDLPDTKESISEKHPDLVLLDLTLPSCSGMDTVRRFKELCPTIPLIVLTGMDDVVMVQAAIAQGAQDFFEKDKISTLPLMRLIRFAIERFSFQARIEQYNVQLESQKTRLNAILESTSDGIVAYDSAHMVQFVNSAALRMLETTSEEIKKQPLFLPGVNEREHIEMEVEGSEGMKRFLELNRNNVYWQDSVLTLVSLRDITDRKIYLEKQLDDRRQEVVDQLAAAIAHEFNNSLAIIRMTAELLMIKEVKREDQLEHLNAMLGETKRSLGLVEKLTSLSREITIRIRPLDLLRFIEDNRIIYAKTLGQDVRFSVECELEQAVILADENALQQVVINLIINARHAMVNGGSMTLRIKKIQSVPALDYVSPNGYLQLEFSDTGCGMSEDVRQRIFDPFFTTKDQGKGTGLGLALVRSIINRHHGWIDCDSEVGKGTTFRLSFPLAAGSDEQRNGTAIVSTEQAVTSVAVVDDNDLLRSLLTDMLRTQGHDVESWACGDALQHSVDNGYKPSIVVVDWMLDEEDGIELIHKLDSDLPHSQFILISGYQIDDHVKEHGKPVRTHILKKPFGAEQLRAMIVDVQRETTEVAR